MFRRYLWIRPEPNTESSNLINCQQKKVVQAKKYSHALHRREGESNEKATCSFIKDCVSSFFFVRKDMPFKANMEIVGWKNDSSQKKLKEKQSLELNI